jgi:hypothetical protein
MELRYDYLAKHVSVDYHGVAIPLIEMLALEDLSQLIARYVKETSPINGLMGLN